MSKSLTVNISNKTFRDSQQPLKVLGNLDFNFNVKPNEFVCILGPSECDKSTLLRLISGLDVDFLGKIILGERVVKGPARDCGIVFQEHRLLPWFSLRDNIKFALSISQNGEGSDK